MRSLLAVILVITCNFCFAQQLQQQVIKKNSIYIIKQDPVKGFHSDYILFVPEKTALHTWTYLLVEPNNTGKLSDDIEMHKMAAIDLASVSSVGNNISTELHIPLLVPVFPRPATDSLLYTHALDRDVMTNTAALYNRLDLQLLAMIEDAKNRLHD